MSVPTTTTMEADTKPTARSLSTKDLSDDEIQLRAQGHVGEMPRQFGLLSALSMGFSITNSWTAFAAILATPLHAGGGPSAVYSLLVATVACSFINAGLAELASAFPSSGGQYQ
jgi:choline transport protein